MPIACHYLCSRRRAFKLVPIASIAAAIIFVECANVAAQVTPQPVKQFAAKCRQDRLAALASARKELAELRKDRDADPAWKKGRIETLILDIAELEDPLKPYHGELIHFFELKVGDIGWFGREENLRRNYFRYRIQAFQVIDASNALIKIDLEPFTAKGFINDETIMWVKGMDTSKLATGGEVDLSGLISVSGTKTYEAVTGTNTVLVLEVTDLKQDEDLFTRKNEQRRWTSKESKFSTDAIFVRLENNRATLVGLDGKTMKVRLDLLSEADRKYVREQITAANEKVKKEAKAARLEAAETE